MIITSWLGSKQQHPKVLIIQINFLIHQPQIDEEIKVYLEKWSLDRLAAVDRNLLRLAVYELKYCSEEVPMNVVLDEAIEIAKLYGMTNQADLLMVFCPK